MLTRNVFRSEIAIHLGREYITIKLKRDTFRTREIKLKAQLRPNVTKYIYILHIKTYIAL